MDIIQILQLMGILAAIIGVPWYIRGRIAKLEKNTETRFTRLEDRQNQVINSLNSVITLIGVLIARLQLREVFKKEDNAEITGAFSQALHMQPISPNPLDPDELARLNRLIGKATHSQYLPENEITEFTTLVDKLRIERGNDPSIWPLIAFGALILGILLGSKGK